MRKLVSIETISNLSPIKDADNIELATIKGWQVVVKKGQFKIGDNCIYFEIDSVLPDIEEYSFLRKPCLVKMGDGSTGLRIKTVKLRGQISQGLALPIGENSAVWEASKENRLDDFFHVRKWEPSVQNKIDIKGEFPYFIPKTDLVRVQNILDVLPDYYGKYFYVEEKLDGTSFTFYKYKGRYGVCSRNYELTATKDSIYWQIAEKYNLIDFSKSIDFDFYLQGEIVGVSVQGNLYKFNDLRLYAFTFYNLTENKYELLYDSKFSSIQVPLLDYKQLETIDTEEADGKSKINNKVNREGIVYKYYEDKKLFSFKIISNQYLLKEK